MSEQTVQAQEPTPAVQANVADPTPAVPVPTTGEANDPAAMTRAMNASQQETARLTTENDQLRTQNELLTNPFQPNVQDPVLPAVPIPAQEQVPTDNTVRLNARIDQIEIANGMAALQAQVGALPPVTQTMIRQQIASTGLADPAYHYWALKGHSDGQAAAKQAATEATQQAAVVAANANATAQPGGGASPGGAQPFSTEGLAPEDKVAAELVEIQRLLDAG